MGSNNIYIYNILILNKKDRERIVMVDSIQKAKYFITNYRWHPEDYTDIDAKEFHSFKVLDNKISTIFKMNTK